MEKVAVSCLCMPFRAKQRYSHSPPNRFRALSASLNRKMSHHNNPPPEFATKHQRSEQRHDLVSEACEVLKFNRKKTLVLKRKHLDDGSAQLIAGALANNFSLTLLNLSHNSIQRVGAQALCNKLAQSSKSCLITLDLSSNNIGDAGGIAVADFIIAHSKLQNIRLSSCEIGPAGGSAIGTSLIYNTSIKCLILDDNPLQDTGITSIATSLLRNSTLETLSLVATQITQCGAKSFSPQKSSNSPEIHLRELNMSINDIGDEGVQSITELIYVTKTLRDLRLSDTNLSDVGVDEVITALGCNTSLAYVDILSGNNISDGGTTLEKTFLLRFQRCLVENSPLGIKLVSIVTNFLDFTTSASQIEEHVYMFAGIPEVCTPKDPKPSVIKHLNRCDSINNGDIQPRARYSETEIMRDRTVRLSSVFSHETDDDNSYWRTFLANIEGERVDL